VLRERAKQGEPDAQWQLYQDLPTEENLVWLCRAADQGQVDARKELGKLYFYGSDQFRNNENLYISKDLPRACMWFYLAKHDLGNGLAKADDFKFNYGPYESPEVERTAKVMTAHELAKAERLITTWEPGQCDRDFSLYMVTKYADDPALARLCIAADQGDFSARDELGWIYFFGSGGVKPDLPRSYMWYHLAEKVYVPSGMTARSMHHRCDKMTPEQRSRAVKLLKEWEPGKCEQALYQ
jgi:TPR repeat protein